MNYHFSKSFGSFFVVIERWGRQVEHRRLGLTGLIARVVRVLRWGIYSRKCINLIVCNLRLWVHHSTQISIPKHIHALAHGQELDIQPFDFSLGLNMILFFSVLKLVFVNVIPLRVKSLDLLVNLLISFDLEGVLVEQDDLAYIDILLLQLLMVTPTLKSISGRDEGRHLFVKLVASSFFLGFHFFFVKFEKSNIFHMFLIGPFPIIFARDVVVPFEAFRLRVLVRIVSFHEGLLLKCKIKLY